MEGRDGRKEACRGEREEGYIPVANTAPSARDALASRVDDAARVVACGGDAVVDGAGDEIVVRGHGWWVGMSLSLQECLVEWAAAGERHGT